MKREEQRKIVQGAKCRVIGWEDARNDGHRLALSVMIRTFDSSESAVLCEPSLARKSHRQADLVLIDPETGVHVLEVKGVTLDQIEGMEAGGQLRIRYSSGIRRINPINQVKNAMFDVKDATSRCSAAGRRDIFGPFRFGGLLAGPLCGLGSARPFRLTGFVTPMLHTHWIVMRRFHWCRPLSAILRSQRRAGICTLGLRIRRRSICRCEGNLCLASSSPHPVAKASTSECQPCRHFSGLVAQACREN